MASIDANSFPPQSGENCPDGATIDPVVRPRPLLSALWAQLLAAPAAAVDRPSGRRRAELNQPGQWPAATLINSRAPMANPHAEQVERAAS